MSQPIEYLNPPDACSAQGLNPHVSKVESTQSSRATPCCPGPIMSNALTVRVSEIVDLTSRVRCFTLVPSDVGAGLPRFTAGSHISVETNTGTERQYSLCNDPDEEDCYVIAVQREQEGRGGSLWMHEHVEAGSLLTIKPPLNNFSLADTAQHHLLIAGGIGITPVLSMVRVLAKQGKSFNTIYLSRSKADAAFLDVLSSEFGGSTQIRHDDEGEDLFDLASALKPRRAGTHVYCCGPSGLMNAVESLTRDWAPETVHFERFSNQIVSNQAGDRSFAVKLAKSGLTVEVGANQSILDALLQRGISVAYSCCEGTCGTCVVKVLDGVPDHRDAVLTAQEKDRLIAICCSRARSDVLILDL
jgi:phthalate 4,5-dioxygenase reductase subunit